ncbi:SGNH/GDSL hydrolase family protein [Modestobacter sp. SYSU DS0290]
MRKLSAALPLGSLLLAGAVVLGPPTPAGSTPAAPAAVTDVAASGVQPLRGDHAQQWVTTWTAMPQLVEPHNMPPAPFTQPGLVLADTTLRQTIHTTIGGDQLRLRVSNAFGGAPLPITKAVVALPAGGQAGASAVQPGTSRQLTFGGQASTVVPTGALMVSDPLAADVPAEADLTVTLYLAAGQASDQLTGHPGSRTTSWLVHGDHAEDVELAGATAIDRWYLISGLEVTAGKRTRAVAVLGDSLSDGRGSTTNGNDRWPDLLAARLAEKPATRDVAVVNQAAGGNRVLQDGLGPNALARLDRDVLAQSGVEHLVVFEGVNDIGTAAATPEAQSAVAAELIRAYQQIVVRAHAQGIAVHGATLLPFGGNEGYDDPAGHREAARRTVNEWIRSSGTFDTVLDFDRVTRDPSAPQRLLPAYDEGDHLHLNPAGYAALAAAVPTQLFR